MASLSISSSFSQPKLTSHEYHVNDRSNRVIFEKDLAKQDEFEPIALLPCSYETSPQQQHQQA